MAWNNPNIQEIAHTGCERVRAFKMQLQVKINALEDSIRGWSNASYDSSLAAHREFCAIMKDLESLHDSGVSFKVKDATSQRLADLSRKAELFRVLREIADYRVTLGSDLIYCGKDYLVCDYAGDLVSPAGATIKSRIYRRPHCRVMMQTNRLDLVPRRGNVTLHVHTIRAK